MTQLCRSLVLAASWLVCSVALAQAPAAAPAGSTGMCKDGSYTSTATKKGACAGHKGVKDWYVADAAKPASAAMATKAAPSAMAAPAMPAAKSTAAPMAPPATAPMAATKPAATTTTTAASPVATAGQVWFNSDSSVYHCSGSRYYGKTKKGEYMSLAAAKAAGGRPANGKECS